MGYDGNHPRLRQVGVYSGFRKPRTMNTLSPVAAIADRGALSVINPGWKVSATTTNPAHFPGLSPMILSGRLALVDGSIPFSTPTSPGPEGHIQSPEYLLFPVLPPSSRPFQPSE